MACKYAPIGDKAAVPVCPYHPVESATQDVDGSADMVDCQKCLLAVLFGAYHCATPAFALTVFSASPVEAVTNLTHFYHFVPDRLQRPPIPLFG